MIEIGDQAHAQFSNFWSFGAQKFDLGHLAVLELVPTACCEARERLGIFDVPPPEEDPIQAHYLVHDGVLEVYILLVGGIFGNEHEHGVTRNPCAVAQLINKGRDVIGQDQGPNLAPAMEV